jgi:hypothetical protein
MTPEFWHGVIAMIILVCLIYGAVALWFALT